MLPYFTCKKSYVKINNGINIRLKRTREIGIEAADTDILCPMQRLHLITIIRSQGRKAPALNRSPLSRKNIPPLGLRFLM